MSTSPTTLPTAMPAMSPLLSLPGLGGVEEVAVGDGDVGEGEVTVGVVVSRTVVITTVDGIGCKLVDEGIGLGMKPCSMPLGPYAMLKVGDVTSGLPHWAGPRPSFACTVRKQVVVDCEHFAARSGFSNLACVPFAAPPSYSFPE